MKMPTHLVKILFCSCFLFISSSSFSQAIETTYRNIYDMLKNVPGLDVQSSNGKGGSITVRGLSSLTRQGQPLFVLNGSIYNGDVGALNPQDIENITVLKDAGSTAAYGAQGSFGVILITTRKGTTGFGKATVESHNESAYTYFIDHKTAIKVFDMNDNIIIEGVIQKQKGDSLVFTKKRKDFIVAISSVKRVEMIPQNN